MTDAERIADDLFTNGEGQRADRLVLTVDGPPRLDLGGWSASAIADQIADHIEPLVATIRAQAAQIEALTAERDKGERIFQAVVYAFEGGDVPTDLLDHGMVRRGLKHRVAAEAQVQALQQALRKFGRHKDHCGLFNSRIASGCTCGLDALRAVAGDPAQEPK